MSSDTITALLKNTTYAAAVNDSVANYAKQLYPNDPCALYKYTSTLMGIPTSLKNDTDLVIKVVQILRELENPKPQSPAPYHTPNTPYHNPNTPHQNAPKPPTTYVISSKCKCCGGPDTSMVNGFGYFDPRKPL